MTAISHRLLAEAVGTSILVMAIIGSGIMAQSLTSDAALALLCNALATAATLVVLITLLTPISGAHLNPVVTIVLAALGRCSWRDAMLYVPAQLVGGIMGTLLAHAMFGLPLLQLGATPRSGLGQWLAEIIATCGLVAVVLLGSRERLSKLPILVGLYILSAYWFTASTSFANPAATIARSLTDTFTGIVPSDAGLFICMQLLAAVMVIGIVRATTPSSKRG